MKKVMIVLLAMIFGLGGFAQDTKSKEAKTTEKKIPANSKVFIAPMGGFEDDLKAAIQSKKVPVMLVTDKDQADYEIAGTAESEKAGAVKKAVMWNWHSNEQASITVTDHKSGEVVFAYSVNKKSSAHGKRSTAEACAKHLKDQIEGK
ncbi:MAG TPA: hypothetical protein VNZ47_09905 [Candidatus Dormibacteraeota bacterium]|jgi:hypothetical protein|nr:hypothetical protein [Candidatus Dormibacteraeota bacterium]